MQKDIKFLTDEFTRNFIGFYSASKCIACGEELSGNVDYFSPVWKEDMSGKVNIFICRFCGTAYPYPFLSISEESKLYDDYFAHHIHENILESKIDMRLKLQDRIDNLIMGIFFKSNFIWLKKFLSCFLFQRILIGYPIFSNNKKGQLKILDIGSGDGHFLSKAKNFGCLCFATEYNDALVDRLKGLGIIAAKSTGELIRMSQSSSQELDVIRINWVLEHVADPSHILTDAYNLLRNEGELIINIPNFNTLAKSFGKYFQLHLPQHRQVFTIKGIKTLVEKHGFKVVYCHTKSMGVMSASFIRKYGMKSIPLALRLFDLVTSVFLDIFNFGDNIEVYAKKV